MTGKIIWIGSTLTFLFKEIVSFANFERSTEFHSPTLKPLQEY